MYFEPDAREQLLTHLPRRIEKARAADLPELLLQAGVLLAFGGEAGLAEGVWSHVDAFSPPETTERWEQTAVRVAAGIGSRSANPARVRGFLLQLEAEARTRLTDDRWDLPLPRAPIEELRDHDLLRAARSFARPHGDPFDPELSTEARYGSREPEAMAALDAYLDDRVEGGASWETIEAFLLCADLAARHGRPEHAAHRLRQWCRESWRDGRGNEWALAFPALVSLILDGVLRETLGLDAATCAKGAARVAAAVDEKRDAPRAFEWPTFLRRLSRAVVMSGQADPRQIPAAGVGPDWLGADGASEDALERAERRLGVGLPPSYRGFLRASNGWLCAAESLGPLWSTEEVDWFRSRNQEWIDIWRDAVRRALADDSAGAPAEAAGDPMEEEGRELAGALEISEARDGSVVLLNPAIIAADGEWEAWVFRSDEGADRHPSFRALMEALHETALALASEPPPAPLPPKRRSKNARAGIAAPKATPAAWRGFFDAWRAEQEKSGQPRPPERPGATASDLASVEGRLGTELPPGLRASLGASDGWPAAGPFIPGLRSTAELAWFRDVHPGWLAVLRRDDTGTGRRLVALLERSLSVSEPGEAVLLLDPGEVSASGEWRGWLLFGWSRGLRAQPSFGRLVHAEYARFRDLSDPAQAPERTVRQAARQARNRSLRGELERPLRELEHLRPAGHTLVACYLMQIYGLLHRWDEISALVPAVMTPHELMISNIYFDDLGPLIRRAAEETADGGLVERARRLAPDWARHPLKGPGWRRRPAVWRSGLDRSFDEAVAQARRLLGEGEPEAAWEAIRTALPAWEACFPPMLAPSGLVTDPTLAALITPELGRAVLESPRGNGWGAYPPSETGGSPGIEPG